MKINVKGENVRTIGRSCSKMYFYKLRIEALNIMEYKGVLETTIKETYPKYLQEKVKKKLEANHIASSTDDLFTSSGESTKLSEQSLTQQLITVLNEKPEETISCIQDLEYFNSYKYSTLFNLNNYNETLLERMIENNLILRYDEGQCDFCTDFQGSDSIKPTFRVINEELVCLKFSNQVTGYLPISDNNSRTIKYPIMVLIHKSLNTVEIRLDKIKGFLKNGDEFFYKKQITFIKEWLESYLKLEINPVNLPPVIEFMRPKLTGNGEVKVTAQAMDLATGAKAILDTGVNDEFVLPLLGELKNLIQENFDLFDSNEQTQQIKVLLNNFILETEETALLPWISLTWTNEIKSKAVKVKFSFNPEYTLLQYYGNNAEMERMNNVTKYIIDNQTEYLKQQVNSE